MISGVNSCLTIKTMKKMKKILFMVAAVALMVLTACNKDEFQGGVNAATGTVEFVAGFDIDTKTALDDTKKKTVWSESDKISINGQVFVISELLNNGQSAKFVNENDLPDGFCAPYTALYPANVTEIPATQEITAGNFDPNAVLERAESDNYELNFQNQVALLKFQVPTACEEVIITSDDYLSAKDSKTVTMTGSFVTGSDYYMAVLPGTKKNFAVKVDGYVVKSAESVNIERSKIITMSLPYNVYLHANTTKYNWTSDGARFATWTWGTGVTDSWFDMVEEGGHDGVYRLEVQKGYNQLIFCRMNGATNDNDWANKWNQTVNISIPKDKNNHFYIYNASEGVWGDGSGLPTVNAETNKIYLRPSANWLEADAHFAAWVWKGTGAGKVYNFKQNSRVPALYEITVPAGSTGMILFRLGPNQKYNDGSTSFPSSTWAKSGDLNIGSNNLYTVVNWLESSSKFSKITSLY